MKNVHNAIWYHGYEVCRTYSGSDYFNYDISFFVYKLWACFEDAEKYVVAKVVRFLKATIIESSRPSTCFGMMSCIGILFSTASK